jgi:hypothetical protein
MRRESGARATENVRFLASAAEKSPPAGKGRFYGALIRASLSSHVKASFSPLAFEPELPTAGQPIHAIFSYSACVSLLGFPAQNSETTVVDQAIRIVVLGRSDPVLCTNPPTQVRIMLPELQQGAYDVHLYLRDFQTNNEFLVSSAELEIQGGMGSEPVNIPATHWQVNIIFALLVLSTISLKTRRQ